MADDASITTSRVERLQETPERLLIRAQTIAILRVLGRKKGEAFLRTMADYLNATQSYLEAVTPIRRAAGWPARREAAHGAVVAFREDLPVYIAGLAR